MHQAGHGLGMEVSLSQQGANIEQCHKTQHDRGRLVAALINTQTRGLLLKQRTPAENKTIKQNHTENLIRKRQGL